MRSPYAGRAGRVLRHAGPAAGLGLEPQAPAAAPGSGRTWPRSCVVEGEPARARGCVGGVLRLASASGMGRNPKGRGSAPGRGQSAGQSCGSTTAKGRAPVALQLRRAPPVFCRELLLHRRRERLDIREHRPALRIQGERARLHLANAHQQLCGTPSQLCEELGCLLLSKSCFGIGPAAAKLSSGVAHSATKAAPREGELAFRTHALRCAAPGGLVLRGSG